MSKLFKATLVLALALAACAGRQSIRVVNLAAYYPNIKLYENNYLEGIGEFGRSVLWFEAHENGIFAQYNSAPESQESRCHWDLLEWQQSVLVYHLTYHECPTGSPSNYTVYNPPITFMPRYWSEEWSYIGESVVNHYRDGVLVCTGINRYTSTLVSSGLRLHFQTSQVTTWDDFGRCAGWENTRWQENYLLSEIPGGKGISRSVGGNLDVPDGTSWDIHFTEWRELHQTVTK